MFRDGKVSSYSRHLAEVTCVPSVMLRVATAFLLPSVHPHCPSPTYQSSRHAVHAARDDRDRPGCGVCINDQGGLISSSKVVGNVLFWDAIFSGVECLNPGVRGVSLRNTCARV